jgi:hypothetical protein
MYDANRTWTAATNAHLGTTWPGYLEAAGTMETTIDGQTCDQAANAG